MIEKLLKEQTNNTLIQIFRYTLSGAISVTVDIYFLLFFTEVMGIHFLLSAAMAYVLSVIVNYMTSINWVFNQHNNRNVAAQLGIFMITGLICLCILESAMWHLTHAAHFHYMEAKIFIMLATSLLNFHLRRYLLSTAQGGLRKIHSFSSAIRFIASSKAAISLSFSNSSKDVSK